MASRDKPYKPSKDHPWNVRTRQQVLAQSAKKKRGKREAVRLPRQEVDVFVTMREDEERFEREELADLERRFTENF